MIIKIKIFFLHNLIIIYVSFLFIYNNSLKKIKISIESLFIACITVCFLSVYRLHNEDFPCFNTDFPCFIPLDTWTHSHIWWRGILFLRVERKILWQKQLTTHSQISIHSMELKTNCQLLSSEYLLQLVHV